MDSSLSVSPRRSYDSPKPETGLAEWTSKIKALQREVDADEEAEQKRLEEEIAAAREARLRRSRGMSAGSRVDSLNTSMNKEQLSFSNNPNDTSANDAPKSTAERENDQQTALLKLMGRNDVYNPDKIAASTAAEKSDPVSLAAFICGRATGPRLNRHAPQQDAHDPTQFAQPDLSAPHPVFGRGGVAMPGMGAKKDPRAPIPAVGSENSERYRPSSATTSKPTSSVASSYLEKIDQSSKKDNLDTQRHSYSGTPKSVSPPMVQKNNDKIAAPSNEISRNQDVLLKPKPVSVSRSSSYLPKSEETVQREPSPQPTKPVDSFWSNQNSFSPAPKAISPSISSSYLPKREDKPTREPSPQPAKTVDSFRSNQNAFSSTPKLISPSISSSYLPRREETLAREPSPKLPKSVDTFRSNQNTFSSAPKSISPSVSSYLPKRNDTIARDPSPLPTKSVDAFRSNQNAFSPTPKSTSSLPLPSYLPKKEDPTVRDSSPIPQKRADSFPSTSTSASKPLPSYIGATMTTKPSFDVSGNGINSLSTTETPLHRLMERNNVHNPDKVVAEEPRKSVAERAQSVSLAAFMGGNARGPRLNRHAPQQDAHDPTQFIQPNTSAPHPIFGRGGIAMPGMATRKSASPSDEPVGSESSERYRPSSYTKPTWPPITNTRTEKAEEAPISPQKTGNRERTISAPSTQLPNVSASQSSGGSFSSNKVAGRQSPAKEARAVTPLRDRTISGPSYSQPHSFASSSFSRSSVTTPSLARPIQPIPKASSLSPQVPITSPSPAFQKPPPAKDLTPSISRLKGRGFVQNMVKASAQFESPPSPSPSSDKLPAITVSGKKSSVLDRWQPGARSSSPTKSTFPSYPNPLRRSTTQAPATLSTDKLTTTSSSLSGSAVHTIKSTTSMPSLPKASSTTTSQPLGDEPIDLPEPYQRSRTPGLGSATTMVLIKPGLPQIPHVDELGVKHESRQGPRQDSTQFHVPAEIPPSSRKPLIHPTKERARKPRKHNEPQSLPGSELSPRADITQANLAQEYHLIPSHQQTQTTYRPRTLILDDGGGDDIQRLNKVDLAPSIEAEHGSTAHTKSPASASARISETTQKTDQCIAKNLERRPESTPSPTLEPPTDFIISKIPEPSFTSSPVKYTSVPSSPIKHVRIPSTGNRPTVMEVAQILVDRPAAMREQHYQSNDSMIPEQPASFMEPSPKPRNTLSQIQAEKRRSSYEKYSAIILPSLKEEATPAPSPAGTLARVNNRQDALFIDDEARHIVKVDPASQQAETDSTSDLKRDLVHYDEPESPLPDVELNDLFKRQFQASNPPSDVQTISVEVLIVTGTTATPLSKSLDIFYDSEILAIIHRVKSKSSGLASTSVWCWLGRKSTLGDREERKVHELAKRYGTNAKFVHQLAEPSEMIQVLGGCLAIRQGARMHWSSENTTMHLIRSFRGAILIDEHELNVKNLCSAFSYCFTILGSVYVWHGRGSTPREREAALRYVDTFSTDTIIPIVLSEGEDDDDEMFWMILGDDDFAKADYWQWRKASPVTDHSIWRVDVDNINVPVFAVEFISMEQNLHKLIYVVNCLWEFFVVVGKEARDNRRAIRFALDLVKKMSNEAASSKPYVPTIHVLILPSQIPLDLRLGVRDLDEAWVNDGEIPDHMNLLQYSEAANHLSTYSWGQVALKDHNMLPLGVGVSDVS